MDVDSETKKLLVKEKKAEGPAWMKQLTKIKESRNEDKSFVETDEEKKSNKGSNRSKSSDDSLNKRDHLEIESPAKHKKDLNIKFSSASEDTDVFNKSPKNNSD